MEVQLKSLINECRSIKTSLTMFKKISKECRQSVEKNDVIFYMTNMYMFKKVQKKLLKESNQNHHT